jgi:outer membrane protein assembly factor BamB
LGGHASREGKPACKRRSSFASQLAVAAWLAALPANVAQAEDWPQFRGPNASGVSSAAHLLPTQFSQTENVAWVGRLGEGVGSPIVAGGRLFATAMTGEREFTVFAFDAATGTRQWKRTFATGKLPRITPPNSHASSTPASDGQRVYVYFSTLGLLALDAARGTTEWQLRLPTPSYLMDWGAASSPIVFRDQVIFCLDDDLDAALYAVDAATGRVNWKAPRTEMLAGYAVPVICEAGGRADVVVAGSGKLKGYDPATGQERWTCNTLVRTIMTTPVVQDDVIYVAVQSYGDEKRTLKYALLEWLDTNQDGILAREELPAQFLARFDQSDRNADGKLAGEELDTAFQSPSNMVGGGSIIQAIRGGGTGDVSQTHLIYNLKNRSPSNISSPLVVGDQLFVVKRGGLSSAFEASTGKPQWQLVRLQNLGDYYGSPVAGDGKIYVPAENGNIVVLAQGTPMQLLAKNDMGEPCIATPAIADGRIYVRTRQTLYCIGGGSK